MSEVGFGRAVARAFLLLAGLVSVLAGGICTLLMAPEANLDPYFILLFLIALAALGLGLLLVRWSWRGLRRALGRGREGPGL